MPFYDYECTKCSNVKEYLMKYEDEPPECEKCGSLTKRLMPIPMVKTLDSNLAEKQKDLANYVF